MTFSPGVRNSSHDSIPQPVVLMFLSTIHKCNESDHQFCAAAWLGIC